VFPPPRKCLPNTDRILYNQARSEHGGGVPVPCICRRCDSSESQEPSSLSSSQKIAFEVTVPASLSYRMYDVQSMNWEIEHAF